jgi:hypothetical protein
MFSSVEAEVLELVVELHVLGMACLKEAAKCLVQPQHPSFFFINDKLWQLPYMHLLLQVPIEEHGLHIEVVLLAI